MERTLLISYSNNITKLAVLEDGRLVEFTVERQDLARLSGNIYLGRVRNIAAHLSAAFVDIGLKRNALLPLDNQLANARQPEPGDSIIVQVMREPDGVKGPRVGTDITVPGRLAAMSPHGGGVGVSRKIIDPERRDRLINLARERLPGGVGWIMRTAAERATDDDILADAKSVYDSWLSIKRHVGVLAPPALLLGGGGLIDRYVRDLAYDTLIVCHVDNSGAYEKTREAFERYAPDLMKKVRLYEGGAPLFEKLNIARAVDGLLDRRVKLKSGGNILIEPCETLTAIDVNSGDDSHSANEREGIRRVNVEAAREIARRIRLLDIGGVILIDFIDMDSDEDRAEVRRVFEESAAPDRGKAHVYGFTARGLLELTRKKVGADLRSLMTEPCKACGGRGVVAAEPT